MKAKKRSLARRFSLVMMVLAAAITFRFSTTLVSESFRTIIILSRDVPEVSLMGRKDGLSTGASTGNDTYTEKNETAPEPSTTMEGTERATRLEAVRTQPLETTREDRLVPKVDWQATNSMDASSLIGAEGGGGELEESYQSTERAGGSRNNESQTHQASRPPPPPMSPKQAPTPVTEPTLSSWSSSAVASEHELVPPPAQAAVTDATTKKPVTSTSVQGAVDNVSKQKPVLSISRGGVTGSRRPEENRFAYAFVVGGCSVSVPTYRYYLYGIFIATQVLREEGSRGDMVAFIQMRSGTNEKRLPEKEEQMFRKMNIQLYYIPKSDQESFYTVSLQKFRILGLAQYKRVTFLDADLLPLGNLDYLMEISLAGVLKENLIVPDVASPANAGFFMVTPDEHALVEVNEIIQKQQERKIKVAMAVNASSSESGFDPVTGWGHEIEAPDQWEKPRSPDAEKRDYEIFNVTSGRRWDFWGASIDQGLLYHYVKYHRRSVSIVHGSQVKNYGPSPSSSGVVLEAILDRPFRNATRPTYRGLVENCDLVSPGDCAPPVCDYQHFFGSHKPWRRDPPETYEEEDKNKSALQLWFFYLKKMNKKLKLGLRHPVSRMWPPIKKKKPPPVAQGEKPLVDQTETKIDLLLPVTAF